MSRSESLRLEQTAADILQRAGLQPQAGVIITATSGGIDSVVLNQVLLHLGYTVHPAHVNYQKRGSDSDQDERFVREMAQLWDQEITVWKASKEHSSSGNFQDWARAFRLQRFQELAEHLGAQAIALGHHFDDRVETLLMRVMRGASPAHWDGLREWNPPLVRPLMAVSRHEILEYAKEHQLSWREDATNQETRYARNLIRHELIPAMDHQLPGWKKNIDRIAEYGSIYAEALDALLVPLIVRDGILIDGLMKYSNLLQQALLQRYLEQQGFKVSAGRLEQMGRLLDAQMGRWVTVEDERVLLRDRERLVFTSLTPTLTEEVWVTVPPLDDPNQEGDTLAEWRVDLPVASLSLVEPGYVPQANEWVMPTGEGPLIARVWRAGDRIKKTNGSTRKISDLINDWKIPTHLKGSVWVLTLDQNLMACIFSHPEYTPKGCVAPSWDQVNQKGILIRPKHPPSYGLLSS